ncbi:MAG TPA: PIG-L family deacetylase, partial [Ktedonobacteraceae bacterium]
MGLSVRQKFMGNMNKLGARLHGTPRRFPRRTFLVGAGASVLVAVIKFSPFGFIASAASGVTLNIVAHEDDDLLFLSPDLLHAIQSGRTVRTIFMTSGDAGRDSTYWLGRQAGIRAAYAQMSGVADSWTQADAGISGHPISVYTLSAYPAVSVAFLHLPDGNIDGSGFASTNHESLENLW